MPFISSICRDFYAHWLRLRGNDSRMPVRTALDPAGIPTILPHVIIYGVGAAPENVIYRLVGTEIVRRWGFDPTGRGYAATVGGEDGWDSARAVMRVAHEPCGMRMVRRQVRPSGAVDDVEILCLPVWDDRRDEAQAISVSEPIAAGWRPLDTEADPVRERLLVTRHFFALTAAEDDPAEVSTSGG